MSKLFEQLLANLNTELDEQTQLAKSLPVEGGEDDEAIQTAAADGEDADDKNPEDDEDEGEEKPIAKSVTAMVDGEEVKAIDATEMLKSLQERVDEHDDVLAKALTTTLATVKAQGEMIKSMSAELKKLAGKGAGRKTVLTVVEKPAAGEQQDMTKSNQDGMTTGEFMAKATAAFAAGKLSGQELTTADVAIRQGAPIPAGIMAKALA